MTSRNKQTRSIRPSIDGGAFHTPGPLELALVLDTNVLLEFGENLERARWYHVLNLLPGKPLSIVIPIQVVEELDGLKDRGTDSVRKLAGMTLRWLDGLFPDQYQDTELPSVNGAPIGRATFRLLVDPLDRVPLPRSDADIIDRALALRRKGHRRDRGPQHAIPRTRRRTELHDTALLRRPRRETEAPPEQRVRSVGRRVTVFFGLPNQAVR